MTNVCNGTKRNGQPCRYNGVSSVGEKMYCRIHYKQVTLPPQPECSICMCSIRTAKQSETTPCNHTFHRSCLGKWKNRRTGGISRYAPVTCPLCRTCITADLLYENIIRNRREYLLFMQWALVTMTPVQQLTNHDIGIELMFSQKYSDMCRDSPGLDRLVMSWRDRPDVEFETEKARVNEELKAILDRSDPAAHPVEFDTDTRHREEEVVVANDPGSADITITLIDPISGQRYLIIG